MLRYVTGLLLTLSTAASGQVGFAMDRDPTSDPRLGAVEIFVNDPGIARFHSDPDMTDIRKRHLAYIKLDGRTALDRVTGLLHASMREQVRWKPFDAYIDSPVAFIATTDAVGVERHYSIDECLVVDRDTGKAYRQQAPLRDWLVGVLAVGSKESLEDCDVALTGSAPGRDSEKIIATVAQIEAMPSRGDAPLRASDLATTIHGLSADSKDRLDPAAIDAMTSLLKSDENAIRMFAANALGHLGSRAKRALPALQRAERDYKEEATADGILPSVDGLQIIKDAISKIDGTGAELLLRDDDD